MKTAAFPQLMRKSICRCKKEIAWLKTKQGNLIPVDPETTVAGDFEFDHTRHTSHFATCPFAKEFRKAKKKETWGAFYMGRQICTGTEREMKNKVDNEKRGGPLSEFPGRWEAKKI